MTRTGVNGEYTWLEVDHDPRSFLGVFAPSQKDIEQGWKTIGNIAYSPRIRSSEDLPSSCCCRDCYGFDEWYVFRSSIELGNLVKATFFTELAPGKVFAFVNYYLRLSDPRMQDITDLFWKKIAWIQPESYIADAEDCLVFATRDTALFTSVRAAVESRPSD